MSDFDPFDNVPADSEAQEAAPAEESVLDSPPADAPKKAPAKKVAVKAASVTGDEGKIVLTFKEGAGFDSSWVVVHANNVGEARGILSDPAFKELLDQSKKAAGYYRGGSASGGGRPAQGGKPAGATEAPANAPAAPGPDWQYKTGLKKDGKGTWQAWMPPRGSDEKPVWF